jgi:hypothetical protein
MRKPAKPNVNANPYILFAFKEYFEEICRLARTGHREREGESLYEPWEIVPRPRRRKGGQEQRKPKSQLRTFADDPRLTKKERNQILAHADSLKKANATFKRILAKIPTDLADPLVGCVRDIVDAALAIGELNPSPILRRLGTTKANASRDTAASKRIDEIIVKVAKPVIERHPTWRANRVATEIHGAVNKHLKAEGRLADDKPLSVLTIRRRLVAQTP